MIDYYEYLLIISWPALSGLFIIYAFLGFRAVQAVRRVVREKAGFYHWSAVSLRAVVTIAVCAIYTYMFTLGYGDWFHFPVQNKGIVESVSVKQGLSGE